MSKEISQEEIDRETKRRNERQSKETIEACRRRQKRDAEFWEGVENREFNARYANMKF